jgi:purine nucleosidase
MPIPVVIDCDPGTDDAIALLLAFASPELDVRAITTVGGNVPLRQTLANALSLTAIAKSTAPVYAGAARPLVGAFTSETRVHGTNGLGGVILPAGEAPAPGIAADAIRSIIRDSAEPVALVGIGPVTNIALAIAAERALAGNIARIVLMGGAWGEGNTTSQAEFNAFSDPEALAIVLDSGIPITLATLELTAQTLISPVRLAALEQAGRGECLRAACRIMSAIPGETRLLHDACAVAWLIRPDLFTSRQCSARVALEGVCRGHTIIDRRGRDALAANAVVLERLDADGFFALLRERLGRLP